MSDTMFERAMDVSAYPGQKGYQSTRSGDIVSRKIQMPALSKGVLRNVETLFRVSTRSFGSRYKVFFCVCATSMSLCLPSCSGVESPTTLRPSVPVVAICISVATRSLIPKLGFGSNNICFALGEGPETRPAAFRFECTIVKVPVFVRSVLAISAHHLGNRQTWESKEPGGIVHPARRWPVPLGHR